MRIGRKLKSLFNKDDEPQEQVIQEGDVLPVELNENRENAMLDAISALQEDEETLVEEQVVNAAEHLDSGEVDVDILESEDELVDLNELNVVEHTDLDDIEDHLADALIEGDLPEEVEL